MKARPRATDIAAPGMVLTAPHDGRLPVGVALWVTLILSGSVWALIIHFARALIG